MTDAIRFRPFRAAAPQSALDDLRLRIRQTRFPEKETVGDWSQGMPLAVVRDFADYWANRYDWRACEAALNAHDQQMASIDGLDIHLLHIRSPHPQARPLLLTHGWPGSILEFLEVIGPLADPVAHGGRVEDAFHLVIPSLPGYGFSGKPDQPGWDVPRIAEAWDRLMNALGYSRYFAQGGDWGSAVTIEIARQNRGSCAAIHSNMVLAAPDPETLGAPSPIEQRALARLQWYQAEDNGYAAIQRTRPQTIGYALADSPVGQMAWILEKFRNWSDCGDDLLSVYNRDALLDNVTLYWLTNSAASSARLYWHSFGSMAFDPIAVPAGGSIFPKELFQASRRWAEKRFSALIYWNELDKGGHFAAFEQPAVFVEEVRACFAKARLEG